MVPKSFWVLELVPTTFFGSGTYSTLFFTVGPIPHLQNLWWNRSQNVGLSPPSAKKNLGPIPTSIFEWDLFHLEAVGLIPWDLVDLTITLSRNLQCQLIYSDFTDHLRLSTTQYQAYYCLKRWSEGQKG